MRVAQIPISPRGWALYSLARIGGAYVRGGGKSQRRWKLGWGSVRGPASSALGRWSRSLPSQERRGSVDESRADAASPNPRGNTRADGGRSEGGEREGAREGRGPLLLLTTGLHCNASYMYDTRRNTRILVAFRTGRSVGIARSSGAEGEGVEGGKRDIDCCRSVSQKQLRQARATCVRAALSFPTPPSLTTALPTDRPRGGLVGGFKPAE